MMIRVLVDIKPLLDLVKNYFGPVKTRLLGINFSKEKKTVKINTKIKNNKV